MIYVLRLCSSSSFTIIPRLGCLLLRTDRALFRYHLRIYVVHIFTLQLFIVWPADPVSLHSRGAGHLLPRWFHPGGPRLLWQIPEQRGPGSLREIPLNCPQCGMRSATGNHVTHGAKLWNKLHTSQTWSCVFHVSRNVFSLHTVHAPATIKHLQAFMFYGQGDE